MVDLLFLGYNRLEFTVASLRNLLANTPRHLVGRIFLYDDGSTDGTLEFLSSFESENTILVQTSFRSPVAIMNDFLVHRDPGPLFAKIDNDTMVCPGWLEQCLNIMDRYPEVDLLGIEALYPYADLDHPDPREKA